MIKIRLFQTQDADRIAQLFHDTVREVNIRDYSIDRVRAWAPDHIYFRNWAEACGDRHTYIAEDKGEIIGFGELESDGRIDCFYCHKDYQRCGVGTRIYRAIEAKALELGIAHLRTESSITAKAFFKSRGFSIVKQQQVCCRGEMFTNYVMEKHLKQLPKHSESLAEKQLIVATFYHFANLFDRQEIRSSLISFCDRHEIKGKILLAEEGLNATVAGSRTGIDALLAYLRSDHRLAKLEHKESVCDVMPFLKIKVKLTKELVSFGVSGIDPAREVGTYVEPKDWNALISDPTVIVIDTRNTYEVEFGTFNGSIDPNLETFADFPKYVEENLDSHKQQKIAMFCTGGIRCEKASAYMLSKGFAEVYHLKGGILKYLAEIPTEESLWQGECFVFDDRIAVT